MQWKCEDNEHISGIWQFSETLMAILVAIELKVYPSIHFFFICGIILWSLNMTFNWSFRLRCVTGSQFEKGSGAIQILGVKFQKWIFSYKVNMTLSGIRFPINCASMISISFYFHPFTKGNNLVWYYLQTLVVPFRFPCLTVPKKPTKIDIQLK